MRRWLMMLVVIINVFILLGCSSDMNKEVVERSKKGEIVISTGKYMVGGGYDPTLGWGMWAYDPFHTGLYAYDENNKLKKELAENVIIDSDGLEYMIELRKDIKFADGTPLTAKDVVFTYITAKSANSSVDLTYLDSVEEIDTYTIKFILNRPWSAFLDTTATLGIVPASGYSKETYGSAPNGTGPWKIIAFQKEQQLIMVPNEYYYGEKPKLKKVTILNIADDAIVAAAKSGQVDLVYLSPEYVDAKVPFMKVVSMDTIDAFTLNLPMEPEYEIDGTVMGNNVTSDLAIRQALNIGINRKEIIQNSLNGYGEPTMNFSRHISWVNEALNEEDNRVEEAKDILEKAGWHDVDGDGVREKGNIKAEFTITGRANDIQRYNVAVALAKDAEKLGIKINAKSMAWAEARKIARNIPTIWSIGDFSPQAYYNYFHSSQVGKNIINNSAMYRNPKVDQYIEAGFAAVDEEVVVANFKKAQWDGVVGPKVDLPYLWIATIKSPYLLNENLELGDIGVNERGQGMGILKSLGRWHWK